MTDAEWKRVVLRTIKRVAFKKESLTTDDVWDALDLLDLTTALIDRRAVGPLMREAAKLGWITGTSMYVTSSRKVAHSRPVKVWSSELV